MLIVLSFLLSYSVFLYFVYLPLWFNQFFIDTMHPWDQLPVEQPLYNAHVHDWVTVLSLSPVQEFRTISQPHSDKLFPLLLSKDNWRLTFLAVRFRVNIRLHAWGFIYMYFIVVMRSRPLFLCMLRTTNPSFDLIWFE